MERTSIRPGCRRRPLGQNCGARTIHRPSMHLASSRTAAIIYGCAPNCQRLAATEAGNRAHRSSLSGGHLAEPGPAAL
jgi:hypothetical protein